ncbi:hypothetical protein FOL47_005666 [Perkinsus chesapeaki]|uniref:Uncharacterized protein n=1 Tax=Perkinsus chesapeaki TaxID=330153 RepID=A0A7J6LW76_PERCH|nr:hypothetical protein FOL47_005666 [Perkinsus chesapeaki]
MAETCVCASLGASGLIAQLPQDSPAQKRLRAVAPFMTSLLGRALVFIIFGMICSGNYTYVATSAEEGNLDAAGGSRFLGQSSSSTSIRVNSTFWAFFCVISGIYMTGTGVITLVYYFKFGDGGEGEEPSVSFSPFTPVASEQPITTEEYHQ